MTTHLQDEIFCAYVQGIIILSSPFHAITYALIKIIILSPLQSGIIKHLIFVVITYPHSSLLLFLIDFILIIIVVYIIVYQQFIFINNEQNSVMFAYFSPISVAYSTIKKELNQFLT